MKKTATKMMVAGIAAGVLALTPAFMSVAADAKKDAKESKVSKDRSVYLTGALTDSDAIRIVKEMEDLDREAPGKPITFHILSEGGLVRAGLMIYEHAMRLKSPITTVCEGDAESMAAFLLTTLGAKGKRQAYPTCQIMFHELSRNAMAGKASKAQAAADRMVEMQADLNEILSRHTGWDPKVIATILKGRDAYMTPEEAKELGFIDEIIPMPNSIPSVGKKKDLPGWLCDRIENPAPFCKP